MGSREVYTRPAGRAGVGPCPGCGDEIVMCLYLPKQLHADRPRRKRAFDYPPAARDDAYANHGANPDLTRAWLITDDRPLEDHHKRLVPHLASHPQCQDLLTRRTDDA